MLIVVLGKGVLKELPVYGSGQAAKRLALIEHAVKVRHQKAALG